MSRHWRTFALASALSATVLVGMSWAQQPAAPRAQAPKAAAAGADEEELFDDKLREFGYWSGAAYGCVSEAKQGEVERKVLDTFNHIGRLFGTDRAFLYAAAFGNGSTVKVDQQKCPDFLAKFEKATAMRGGK